MKKFNLILGLAGLLLFAGNVSAQVKHCGMTEYMQKLYKENPQLKKDMAILVQNAKTAMKSKAGYDSTTVYIIPVVFHILHQYGAENISDAQVYDEMRILNEDYSLTNPDTNVTIDQYQPIMEDAKIEFRLAGLDPEGNCTNGIEHIYTHLTNQGDDYSKIHQWPRSQYLNVWVVKTIGSAGVAGYAFYPSGVEGAGFFRDGIIILSNYIGSIGTSTPYNSRALTHEIGHYLGLAHTWGSTNDPEVACGNDFVEDTPKTKGHANCGNLYDITCSKTTLSLKSVFDNVSTTSGASTEMDFDSTATFYTMINVDPLSAVGVSANSTKDSIFAFSGWGTGSVDGQTDSTLLTGAIDLNKYYEFSLTPTLLGYGTYNLIKFTMNRSATGPRTFAVRSSIDGFSTNMPGYTVFADSLIPEIGSSGIYYFESDTSTTQTITYSLTAPNYTGVEFDEPITFRIYAWNAEDNAGSFDLEYFELKGDIGIIENVQNYMEYSYCSTMFTHDQVVYMRTVLNSITSSRNNLVTEQNHIITGTNVLPAPVCSPLADFNPSTKFTCAGTPVTFTDYSHRAPIDTYSWTFEGGTPATSSAQSPTVTFSGSGWHKVTLTVSNANGSNTKTDIKSVFTTSYTDILGPYVEDFEGQSANWWQVVNPEGNYAHFALVSGEGYSDSKCMKLNNYKDVTGAEQWEDDYYYVSRLGNNIDYFVSPNFDLSNTSGASLTFKYAYSSNTTDASLITETLKVYMSTDCGQTWQTRKSISGSSIVTAGTGWIDYIPSDVNQWATVNVPISVSSADHNVRFKFEFLASDYSNNLYIDDININGTLGIPDNPLANLGVNVYPNPSRTGNTINVSYTANGKPMTIQLIDMTGRVVYSAVNNQKEGAVTHKIDATSNIAPGVYSFRISDGNYFLDKKVVIQ